MTEKKKIADIDTRNWSEKNKETVKKFIRQYKYQVNFQMPDGRIRFAYTNDEPELTALYMKSIGAKILKVSKIDSASTD